MTEHHTVAADTTSRTGFSITSGSSSTKISHDRDEAACEGGLRMQIAPRVHRLYARPAPASIAFAYDSAPATASETPGRTSNEVAEASSARVTAAA